MRIPTLRPPQHPAWSVPALALYGVAVFLATSLTARVGPVTLPNGTHLAPVWPPMGPWPGVLAPSGVYAAGVVLVTRDVIQRTTGRAWSLAVIALGLALNAAFTDVHLALASGAAFLFSELADYLVYTPLQARRFVLAVAVSTAVGAVIDSLLFLGLAGIPYAAALLGLLIGKAWVAGLSVPVMRALRARMPVASKQSVAAAGGGAA